MSNFWGPPYSGFNVQQRVYGTVDYKKARYVILPEQTVRQALFIDSKAEKEGRSATIQMSQTSMWVRQRRSGTEVNEKGFLPEISEYGGKNYLTTTCLIHFKYHDDNEGVHHLSEVTIVAIPLMGNCRNAITQRLMMEYGWRVEMFRHLERTLG